MHTQHPEPLFTTDSKRVSGVTARTIVLSLFLATIFGYCIPIVDFQMSNTFLGAMHMPAAALATLLVLLLIINPLLGLLSKRAKFSRNEILTVYISCLFSSLVPGRGAENFVIPTILAPFYFATKQNKVLETLSPYLKPWMSPALGDRSVAVGWYEGISANQHIPWGAWLVPLAAWSVLILTLYIMQGCLGVILRAQWAGNEALAFPLLRLPLAMTEDVDNAQPDGGFWQNPLVWVGMGIVALVQLLNGLHLYFPDVPEIPLYLATSKFFTEAPWNQLGNVQVQVFPAIVGISFLLTSEVSFSLWFFHVFSKLQYVAAYMVGVSPAAMDAPFWTRGWAKGFIGYQQVGALLAYVAILVWLGRDHWKYVANRAFGRIRASDAEREEALSYPVAFWGFFVALAVILAWTIAAGVRPHIAVLLWGLYLAVALALTRLVAEGGLLFVQTGWMPLGPLAFLVGAGPGKLIDAASAVPGSFISAGLMLDMRGFLLPSFVQSFKLAHDRKIAAKPLLSLVAAVTVVSCSLSFWTIVGLGYHKSGLALQPWWGTGNWSQAAVHAQGLMKGLDTNYADNWFWVAIGAALTWGIMCMRARYAWFPLHPIGLLMMVPFAMHAMWLSIALGWACKVLISKFGGTEAYRKAIPFFLGVALGDIVMAVFWVVIDGWQGRTGHALLPF